MRVVDASVLVEALGGGRRADRVLGVLEADGDLHAPHLVDVEVASALRGLVLRGQMSDDAARAARVDLHELPLTRYPHGGLLERAWELRHTLSVYDAVYVALAELLDAPVLTGDRRLATATGHRAAVELLSQA